MKRLDLITSIIFFNIYIKYIDQDVAIDSFRLGLSLDDEILPDYRGKATICLTEDSVMTKKSRKF